MLKAFRADGLRNVRFEPVPVDVFEFKSATLTVGDRTMIASTFGGVPPTPAGGITADVVYVHGGTAADFDAAGDVTGKIVLMDKMMTSWWYNMPAFEAGCAAPPASSSPSRRTTPSTTPSRRTPSAASTATTTSRRRRHVHLQNDGDWLKARCPSQAR